MYKHGVSEIPLNKSSFCKENYSEFRPRTLTHLWPIFHFCKRNIKVANFLIIVSKFLYNGILPQVFFTDSATENQRPGFSISETLTSNDLCHLNSLKKKRFTDSLKRTLPLLGCCFSRFVMWLIIPKHKARLSIKNIPFG